MAEQHVQNEVNETPLGELNTDDTVAGTNHLNEAIGEESEIEKLKEAVEEEKRNTSTSLPSLIILNAAHLKNDWN